MLIKQTASTLFVSLIASQFWFGASSSCVASPLKAKPLPPKSSQSKTDTTNKLRQGVTAGKVMPIENNWKMPQPPPLAATEDAEEIQKRTKIPSTNRDYLEILNKANRAIAANPKDVGAYVDMAYAYRNLGQFEDAMKNCETALKLDPNLPVAHGERGLICASLDNDEEALKSFNRAIELDPNNSAFYSHRAWIYAGQKKNKEAIAEATESIKIWDGFSPAYFCRGRAYLDLGEWQKAIDDFGRAIKLFPNEVGAYYQSRAYAYWHIYDYRNSLLDLIVAIRLQSKGQLFNIFQQIALLHPDAFEKALLDLNFKVMKNPRDLNAILDRAIAYSLVREFDKALADLNIAGKLAPNSGLVHRERGLVYLNTGRAPDAVTEFEQAVRLNPEDDSAKNRLRAAQALALRKGPMTSLMIAKAITDHSLDGSLLATKSDNDLEKSQAQARSAVGEYIRTLSKANLRQNLPTRADFDLLAQRDLDKHFSKELNQDVHVEFELLDDSPEPVLDGFPTIICWLKAKANQNVLKEGAATLITKNKQEVVVQNFFSIAQIKASPEDTVQNFPSVLRAEILFRAGVKPHTGSK